MPILDEYLTIQLDAAGAERYEEMKARYRSRLRLAAQANVEEDPVIAPPAEAEEGQEPRRAHLNREGSTVRREGSTAAEIFDRLRREPPI
jgi:hypothetical protein